MAKWTQPESSRKIEDQRNVYRIPVLMQMAPTVFDFETYLYIGARDGRFTLSEFLKEKQVTILEAYYEYIEDLQKVEWLAEVIHTDFVDFKTDRKWDVVIWWHGPEHLDDDDLEPAIAKVEQFANHLVILAGPWGFTKIVTKHINPWEFHRARLEPKNFLKFGYNVRVVGKPDDHGNQLCAVKTLDPNCL